MSDANTPATGYVKLVKIELFSPDQHEQHSALALTREHPTQPIELTEQTVRKTRNCININNKMVFGRKKKQDREVVVETDTQDDDLALAYGTNDVDGTKGDESVDESVAPPPPEKNVNDSMTVDNSLGNDVGLSMMSDEAEAKKTDPNKRNKLILILIFATSFFVLLGLTIKFGKSRNGTKMNESVTTPVDEVATVEPPIVETKAPVIEEAPPAEEVTALDEDIEAIAVEDNFVEEEEDPLATVAPTDRGSSEGTDNGTEDGTEDGTEEETGRVCIENDIQVLAGCDFGQTSVAVDFCFVDDVTDVFWEWIDYPGAFAQFAENNWGWLDEGFRQDYSGVPEGTYVIGLFANGREVLPQYPLITEREFTVVC